MRDYFTIEQARAQLPKVGDVRVETPTIDQTSGIHIAKKPMKGVVVYVNREKLWYTVRFENGTRESYKVPILNTEGGGK